MSKNLKVAPGSRPVIVPEFFSGEGPYEDWIDQFESIGGINHWSNEQKLMWLKVCLTLMAYKKFTVTTNGLYKKTIIALQERFKPESNSNLYLAKFQT